MNTFDYWMTKYALDLDTLQRYKGVMNPDLYARMEQYQKSIPQGVTAGQHISGMNPYDKAVFIDEAHKKLGQNNLMHSYHKGYGISGHDPSEWGANYIRRYHRRVFNGIDPASLDPVQKAEYYRTLYDPRHLMDGHGTPYMNTMGGKVMAPNQAWAMSVSRGQARNNEIMLPKKVIKKFRTRYPWLKNWSLKQLYKQFRW